MGVGLSMRAGLTALSTAVPNYTLNQTEAVAVAANLFGPRHAARVQKLFTNTGISSRRICMPLSWYADPHSFTERNALFIEHAVELLCRATQAAMAKCDLPLDKLDAIVTVSSSGIATPSLDALVIERLKLRRDIARLPIFGLGCAGGVIGLARAAELAQARPGQSILFQVVELCSLTFRHGDHSKSNQVAAALFGDGAAAVILNTDLSGPKIIAAGEHTWDATLDIMGWTISDDGLGVLFSRDIPALTRTHYRSALNKFLHSKGFRFAEIDHFVCHPGGAKVIDALELALDLPVGDLRDARHVLGEYGNMSAATILFVLERALQTAPNARHLMTALGPGFTAAFLILANTP